jgi:hypothetical protein
MLSNIRFSNYYQTSYQKKARRSAWSKCLLPLTLFSALALLSACQSQSQEEQVSEVAHERWQALIKGDFEAAYPYYTQAYRDTTPFEHFRHSVRGVGMWSDAEVLAVECETAEKRCEAKLKISVVTKMRGLDKPLKTSTVLDETWVYEGRFQGWKFVKK